MGSHKMKIKHKIMDAYNDNFITLLSDGNCIGKLTRTNYKFNSLKNIKSIFGGYLSTHFFCITEDNKLYAIGNNECNQFGIKTKEKICYEWTEIEFAPDNIVQVEPGQKYSIFLRANGELYVAGECIFGALGLGKYVKKSPELFTRIPIKTKIKKICLGNDHCLSIDEDDHLWSWGYNCNRECGLGINDPYIWKPTMIQSMKNVKISQICAGRNHCFALSTELDTVYAWGANGNHQCGNEKAEDDIVIPTSIGLLKGKKIKSIKSGARHAMAVTQSNDYYLWGNNKHKTACLVDNDAEYVKIPKIAFTDKYQKISDVFLGYNTHIVYTVSGKEQSFDMKQGLNDGFMRFDTFKLALDTEPISEKEEKKNIEDEDEDDNKYDNEPMDEPKYRKMIKNTRTFTETTKEVDVKIPVGKIANALVASIGNVASGGCLAPLLIPQLKDAVINASWGNKKTNEDIVEHFFEGNTYIFVKIKKETTKKGLCGSKKIEFKAKTNYFYMEAGNDAAKKKLQKLQRNEAEDALNFINNQKGWSG